MTLRRLFGESWIGSFFLIATSCSVLTKSQINEVTKFAKAADSYSALPGAVVKADADIWEATKLLEASKTTADQGWNAIVNARRHSDTLYKDAERADKALAILKTYGDLLLTLVSDKPTTALDKSAESLGKSLDNAIKLYNKSYGTDFTSVGSWAAAAVRAGGGIYIRHRQEELLQQYVAQAQPIIEKLNRDVSNLTDIVANQIKDELTALKNSYDDLAKTFYSAGGMPVSTLQAVRDAYRQGQQALKLAPLCKKAARDYTAAHEKLRSLVMQKQTVRQAIEEIETLETEIEAANKIRTDMEKK
jgi:chaperonin cofactor prefoldin